jgi:exonuclease I
VNASIWIRTISINNGPPVLPVNSPRDSWVQMCETLKNKSEFRETVGSLMVARSEAQAVEVKPVDEQIYGGFYSRKDQNILQDFQAVDWQKRVELISTFFRLTFGTQLSVQKPHLRTKHQHQCYNCGAHFTSLADFC